MGSEDRKYWGKGNTLQQNDVHENSYIEINLFNVMKAVSVGFIMYKWNDSNPYSPGLFCIQQHAVGSNLWVQFDLGVHEITVLTKVIVDSCLHSFQFGIPPCNFSIMHAAFVIESRLQLNYSVFTFLILLTHRRLIGTMQHCVALDLLVAVAQLCQ